MELINVLYRFVARKRSRNSIIGYWSKIFKLRKLKTTWFVDFSIGQKAMNKRFNCQQGDFWTIVEIKIHKRLYVMGIL